MNAFDNRFENSDMKQFLIEKANLKERNKNSYIGYGHYYHETTNDQLFDGDKIDSYVYRVGVLYMFDGNKLDFAEMHIAFQSDKNGEMLYLGKLDFKHGENMDLENTAKRIAISMAECLL